MINTSPTTVAEGVLLPVVIPQPAHLPATMKSANSGSKARTCRAVRFSTEVDVREVPHIRDLSKDEQSASWYTLEDFDAIKKDMIATIRLMISNKPIGEDRCTRGLEFRTPAGARLRKQTKLDALTAVWNEQVSQWKRHQMDEERLSFVYQRKSYKSRQAARTMGLRDETEVEPQDDNEDEVSSSLSSLQEKNGPMPSICECEEPLSINFYKESTAIKPILKHTCGPAAA